MSNFKKILGSQYPVVAMAMNRVSDINLAKAVDAAGGVASLSVFNYDKRGLAGLDQDLEEFGHGRIIISLGVTELINPKILDLILKHTVEFIELIPDTTGEFDTTPQKNVDKKNTLAVLKSKGVKVFVKCIGERDVDTDFAGVILKGSDGAGRGLFPTKKLFEYIRNKYPTINIIVSGGVGTADDVKYYIDKGALAVGIGTLLAASQESKVSTETKLKMIESTSHDLREFNNGAKQKSLIFTETEDDYNHTYSLAAGVQNPSTGHIFAGNAIDHVTDIKPVADIINALVAKL
jgi:NAD(P)H-dependent flavin oxidoreductase YrpB (nitropropane dioxygenase family)